MISVEGEFVLGGTGEGEFGIKRENIGVLAGFGLFLTGMPANNKKSITKTAEPNIPQKKRRHVLP